MTKFKLLTKTAKQRKMPKSVSSKDEKNELTVLASSLVRSLSNFSHISKIKIKNQNNKFQLDSNIWASLG